MVYREKRASLFFYFAESAVDLVNQIWNQMINQQEVADKHFFPK
jgi:hypothetical protein